MKGVAQNIALIIGINLLVKPVWVLMENIVQDQIGHEFYGLFSALLSLVLVLSIFLNLGVNHYVTNVLSNDEKAQNSIMPSLIGLRILLLLAFPVLCVGIGWAIGYKQNELWYLVVIALSQALLQFGLLFRANFQAFQHFVIDSVSSVFDRLLLIMLVAGLFLGHYVTLDNFVYARLLAFLASLLLIFGIARKKYGVFKVSFSAQKLKKILLKTFPFALMSILYAINERIDMTMVERMHSQHEAGLYAGAYRWYDAFMMIVWLISPMFFSKFSNPNENSVDLLKHGKILVALPIVFVGGILIPRNEFMYFLFRNSSSIEITQMSTLLSILLVAYLINGIFVIYGTYLNATGFVKKVNKVIALSIVLNIILNLWLIPEFGALASAYTTVLSTFVLGFGYFLLIRKQIEIDVKLIGKLISMTLLFIGILWSINAYFIFNWWLYIIVGVSVYILLFLSFGFLTPFVNAIKRK